MIEKCAADVAAKIQVPAADRSPLPSPPPSVRDHVAARDIPPCVGHSTAELSLADASDLAGSTPAELENPDRPATTHDSMRHIAGTGTHSSLPLLRDNACAEPRFFRNNTAALFGDATERVQDIRARVAEVTTESTPRPSTSTATARPACRHLVSDGWLPADEPDRAYRPEGWAVQVRCDGLIRVAVVSQPRRWLQTSCRRG